MSAPSLPPVGSDWKIWGRQLVAYLKTAMPKLQWKKASDIPSDNGIILWDEINKYPVVSKDGVFRQVVLADGYSAFSRATDVTAALADTAYVITYDAPAFSSGISRGSPTSRLVFAEGGNFLLSFTAQIYSSSGSTKTFYFWPRINGVDVAGGSSIRAALSANGQTTVVSRSAIFTIASGDYLEVGYAFSSTDAALKAFTATAFAPAAPSTTLSICRISG